MTAYTSEYLQSIIDGIHDPVVVIDRDYTVSFMNQAARTSADNHSPSGDRRSCHQLLHGRNAPCDVHAEPCPLHEVLETGKPVRLYHRHDSDGARTGIVEISASPLRGEQGECVGIVEILRHIDDSEIAARLKASEERLRASREALVKEHAELSRVFKLVEIAKREWEKTMDCVDPYGEIRARGPGDPRSRPADTSRGLRLPNAAHERRGVPERGLPQVA